MGGTHSHRRDEHGDAAVEVSRTARGVLLGFLAFVAGATLVGLVMLWPDGERADDIRDSASFSAPGVTYPTGSVEQVEEPCPTDQGGPDCGQLQVSYDGESYRLQVPPEVLGAGLDEGDPVRLIRTPAAEGEPARVSYFGLDRSTPIWVLTGIFVLVVVAVARLRGLLGLVGLAFAGAVLLKFILPALLTGEDPIAVGLVGSAAIMYVVLYTTHGLSLRTSAALAGTHLGVVLTAVLGWLAVRATHLTGVADESGGVLTAFVGDLDFQGLLTCAVIVAGLGVLNDVTITQSSAVWELRAAAPTMSRAALFASGMRIGRDHIASTIYTIVFAYAGTALTILLVLELYGLPVHDLLATEEIGQEVVRTLATTTGLVLAMPLTTIVAAAVVPGPRPAGSVDPAFTSGSPGPAALAP